MILRRAACFLMLAVAFAFVAAGSAGAQGFMVKPMRIEAGPRAGQVIEVPLQIRNTSGEGARSIDVRLVELSQSPNGGWKIAGPEEKGLSSSMAWTSLSEARVDIAPLEPAVVMVRFSPPVTALGTYTVGIIAETPAPQESSGLVVRMRFLIPVIVQIQGRPVRQNIKPDDLVMHYHDGSDGKPASTTAHIAVANRGQTASRVSGQLTIERKNGDRWRPVTRFAARERTIIPGVTLELGEDLKRRLPSGDYRLRGEVFVDGRRVAPLEKEIAFQGDPKADTLAYDTALVLTPEFVDMEIVPGATRTSVLRIENPGTDAVTVHMNSATPRGLVGVEFGALSGLDLSAEKWTEVRPNKFTLRPGARQNVRVMSRVPREGVSYPHYYGDLLVSGTYGDGQSAGETRSTIHLSHRGAESIVRARIEQVSLAEGDGPHKFIGQMTITNTGNIHTAVSARLLVLTAQGVQVRSVPMSGEEATLLPLGKRFYSADLDLEGIEPGYYALRATATIDGSRLVTGQQIMLVEDGEQTADGGTVVSVPRVTLVDPQSADLPEGISVDMGGSPVIPADKQGQADPDEARQNKSVSQ